MPKATKKEDQQKLIKVRAEVMWSFTQKPNEMSGKYQVDLCNLSEKAVDAIEALGVDPRKDPEKKEKGYFVTCKSARPITVVFPDGEKFEEVLGNGSKVTAVLGTYDWTFKNKKGVSLSIKKLIVNELVEYAGAGDDDDIEDIDGDDTDEEF